MAVFGSVCPTVSAWCCVTVLPIVQKKSGCFAPLVVAPIPNRTTTRVPDLALLSAHSAATNLPRTADREAMP